VHSELAPEVHVSELVQCAIAVHNAQLSTLPCCRNLPLAHVVHCESAALVQLSELVQNATGVQAWQDIPSP
jgi:hypothetical protein